MKSNEHIELLKVFAQERFGSLRRMSLAVGKSQNYFAECFAREKMPPPHILRKLEGLGLPMESFESFLHFPGGAIHDASGEETAGDLQPERSAREEYEALHMYGGKPEWLELPEELRVHLEQRFALLQMEIDESENTYRREKERLKLERNGRIAGAVGAFRRTMLRRLLGERPAEGEVF